MSLDRFEVFDPLNETSLVVEALDHEDAACVATEKWNREDYFLRENVEHEVEVLGPLPTEDTRRRFAVSFYLDPVYRAHETQ